MHGYWFRMFGTLPRKRLAAVELNKASSSDDLKSPRATSHSELEAAYLIRKPSDTE
jgi:hypothetical protein